VSEDRASTTSRRLLTAEEIATQAGGAIPFLRLPVRASVFADRAARLRALAPGHAMADFLEFAACIADEQHALLGAMAPARLPDAERIAQCNAHGLPPLGFATLPRDPAWRTGLRSLLAALAAHTPGNAHAVMDALRRQGDDYLEAQASKLLAGVMRGLDIAHAPLIGAALQVAFTNMALSVDAAAIRPLPEAALCPCCGHRPVASVVRIGGADGGYRFLHCGLCNVEWHLVRITCANCLGTKGIAYQAIDDGTPAGKHAVQAEVCQVCSHYTKICYQDRNPLVDPVADDLASLALDLLLGDAGLTPTGVNFLLVHGDPQPAADQRQSATSPAA
jgi:FdhE protein